MPHFQGQHDLPPVPMAKAQLQELKEFLAGEIAKLFSAFQQKPEAPPEKDQGSAKRGKPASGD